MLADGVPATELGGLDLQLLLGASRIASAIFGLALHMHQRKHDAAPNEEGIFVSQWKGDTADPLGQILHGLRAAGFSLALRQQRLELIAMLGNDLSISETDIDHK